MTDRQPFTPESLFELCWVSDPQIAPDGTRVAYVEHWVEEGEKDGKRVPLYRTALFLSEGPDKDPRRLTRSVNADDWMPRWSPDGRAIAFLSTREGNKAQLFVLDLDGGEARPVTRTAELSEGVKQFDWHPGGVAFCFVSTGHKTDEERKADEERDERVYEGRLPFKFDGVGLFEHRRAQLWAVERDGSGLRQLTWCEQDVQGGWWSPRGGEIAFISTARPEHERQYVKDLFVVGVEGGEPRLLTRSEGPVASPVWDPDGKGLLYLGHNRRLGNATNVGVWHVGLDGGESRCLSDTFDRSVGCSIVSDTHAGLHSDRPVWDGDSIIFLATDHGRCGLYRVDGNGGPVTQLNTSGMSVIGFTAAAGTIAFSGESNARMAEVFTMTCDGHGITRRSHAADHLFSRYDVCLPSHLEFQGADGWALEGWVLKPRGWEQGRTYPLILYIHGGPHWDYGNSFFHEFQVLAAHGYGVLYFNPRGSRSYGEAFTAAVRRHFGEQDWEDLLCAADLAAGWDWVDAERMCIVGGSYGGYLTNWAITHTHRFAAACTQRSISNWVSFIGTSDIGPEFGGDELGVMPWEDEELLMAKSPLRYVKNVRTPTLILHQEGDQRCPIEQGEQLYTALVCLGVPTKFVRFPGESHGMSRHGQPR
ncbi:MAG: S9 family peptidase, partial [Chloroflexota bacterium]|nr:S9 family peptidase [Chloroflexota bacterium]